MIKDSEFRRWLRNMWEENCREREEFKEQPMKNVQEYFQRYKYWLKREFKFQRSK